MLFFNHIGHYFAWKQGQAPVGSSWTGLYSYEFDGVNENIELKDFPTIASDYSFSFWFKTTDGGANNYILGATSSIYHINMNFGQLQVTSSDNSFDIVGAAVGGLSDGEWHMATYTYNRTSGDFKCYIDGVLKVTNSATTGVNLPEFSRIGSSNFDINYYTGRIDEFVIFTSELDATDITTLYNNSFPAEVTSPAPANYMHLGDGDAFVKGLNFDGINEWNDFGDNLDKSLSDSFSLSAWIVLGASHNGTIVGKTAPSPYEGYRIEQTSTRIRFIFTGTGGSTNFMYIDSASLTVGNLYHIVATYDGSNNVAGMNLYVNDVTSTVRSATATLTGDITNTGSFEIGAIEGTLRFFNSTIIQAAIYDSELTSGNVTTLYNSGVPKLATALGLSPTNEWDLTKEFKKSLTFDGVNEYIGFGNNIDKEKTDAFSLSTWVKIGSNHIGSVISKELNTGNKEGYLLYLSTNKFIFYLSGDNSSVDRISRDSSGTFNLGELYHIACTYDGSNTSSGINFYVNGVLANGAVQGISMIGNMSNTADFNIGSRDNGNVLWDGEIGISSVFDSELTAENVATLYNGGVPDTAVNLGLTPTNEWDIYNEDVNYFDGTNHIIVDQVGSINGASVNMESGDVTDVFWAIRDEVGSIDGKSVNMESTDATGIGWAVEDSVGTLQGLSVNMEETDRKMGVGYSASFNGTDEYVNHGNVLDFEKTDEFTLSAWVKFDGGAENAIFSKIDGTNTGYVLTEDGTGKIAMYLWSGGSFIRNYILAPTDNVWYHVLVTYDGSNTAGGIKGYIDSVLRPDSLTGSPLAGSVLNTANLEVGNSTNFSFLHDGHIMMYSIFNKKLNQLEINTLYNNGVPITASQAGLSASAELDCILFGSEDTATTIKDYSGNGYNGTLVNMDLTNKSSDTP